MRQAFGVVVLALLVVVPGCGGGGEESASTEVRTVTVVETGGTATEAVTTTGITESEAEALAESMLLRLSDFPTGWRGEPHEETEACAGIEKLTERYAAFAKADSDDFAKGDSTEAASSAALFRDEETARAALNYIESSTQSERFRDCLNDYLREQAGEGVTFGDVRVGQVSFPQLGDRSSAWEVVIPVETQGISGTAYADAVFIRSGSALASVEFSDVYTPFDESERERLARLVAKRMEDALSDLSD